MKASIKKISKPIDYCEMWTDEWLILISKKVVAVAWNEKDAKLIAKAIRKYKPKRD